MEETWTVTTPEGAVTVRHYDPARELLFGLYCASLINPPQTQYYYPVIAPYLSGYSYCPPDIWADWSPLQRSLWIQSGRESELRDYEYRLQRVTDDFVYDLKREMERAKDDIEDAKDELESKKEEAEDAADELEDAAYDAKIKMEEVFDITPGLPAFSEKSADIPKPPPGFVLDKKEPDFSFLDDRRQLSEDQVEVIQWFGPSAGKKFVLVGIDYAKRAQGLVFSVEYLVPEEIEVVYGMRWPPKPGKLAVSEEQREARWKKPEGQIDDMTPEEARIALSVLGKERRRYQAMLQTKRAQVFEEKEISRTTENGLANAIKEIIDEFEAKDD